MLVYHCVPACPDPGDIRIRVPVSTLPVPSIISPMGRAHVCVLTPRHTPQLSQALCNHKIELAMNFFATCIETGLDQQSSFPCCAPTGAAESNSETPARLPTAIITLSFLLFYERAMEQVIAISSGTSSWTCIQVFDGFGMLLALNAWYGSTPHEYHGCSMTLFLLSWQCSIKHSLQPRNPSQHVSHSFSATLPVLNALLDRHDTLILGQSCSG